MAALDRRRTRKERKAFTTFSWFLRAGFSRFLIYMFRTPLNPTDAYYCVLENVCICEYIYIYICEKEVASSQLFRMENTLNKYIYHFDIVTI